MFEFNAVSIVIFFFFRYSPTITVCERRCQKRFRVVEPRSTTRSGYSARVSVCTGVRVIVCTYFAVFHTSSFRDIDRVNRLKKKKTASSLIYQTNNILCHLYGTDLEITRIMGIFIFHFIFLAFSIQTVRNTVQSFATISHASCKRPRSKNK